MDTKILVCCSCFLLVINIAQGGFRKKGTCNDVLQNLCTSQTKDHLVCTSSIDGDKYIAELDCAQDDEVLAGPAVLGCKEKGNVRCVCNDTLPLCIDNPCVPNPCEENQICLLVYEIGIQLAPVCKDDPCEANPCLNGGTCTPTVDVSGYTCQCTPMWHGDNCQIQVCRSHSFVCTNGKCQPGDRRCNGINLCGCPDCSDEMGCNQNSSCTNMQFQCPSDLSCVALHQICDGTEDCADGSDEESCDGTPNKLQFKCDTGKLIPSGWRCDGHNDCEDNDNPTDFSDEENCTDTKCGLFGTEFVCEDNNCIPYYYECDGEKDCPDESDEKYCSDCSHGFLCDNQVCISSALKCDGGNDCGDWSDEENCI